MKIMYLHFSQTQTILVVNTLLAYFVVSRNANLLVHERLTNLHRTLKCTFCKENFLMKNLREENFCDYLLKHRQINFGLYRKKDNK